MTAPTEVRAEISPTRRVELPGDVLHPDRVAELEKAHGPRQTGGEPLGIADDPLAMLNLLTERGPKWIEDLEAEASGLEQKAREKRALADRVRLAMKAAG